MLPSGRAREERGRRRVEGAVEMDAVEGVHERVSGKSSEHPIQLGCRGRGGK